MPKTNLPSLLQIQNDFPNYSFVKDDVFHWSPRENRVYYDPKKIGEKSGIFQLLHEIGHALLEHKSFTSSIQLLKLEVEAWENAKDLAKNYSLTISLDHIEQCLDSYRDWLYLRSKCPNCNTTGLEANPNQYHCFNCLQDWRVPASQRKRQYRMKATADL